MCLGAALIAAILYPSTAFGSEDPQKVCENFLTNHLGDPAWEQACLEAMEAYVPDPDRAAAAPPAELPRPTVPENQVQSGDRIDGDRDRLAQQLRAGETVEAIVEFDVRTVDVQAFENAFDQGRRVLAESDLAFKREEYATIKQRGLSGTSGVEIVRDYENISSTHVRLTSEAALSTLATRPEVRAVHAIKIRRKLLNESLPLIQQPGAAAAGQGGAGTTVAVLDTGVDFTIAPFGCTAPGVPAGCRVTATFEAATNDGQLDDDGHGTNVSAIVHETAGDADVIVADVFTGAGAADPDIVAAINWAIGNQAAMNVVSMNLSLGDTSVNTVTCGADPLATPLANALAAGIQPIIASGNTAFFNGSFDDGVASPACVPAAVSVGAVYDANLGGPLGWGSAPFNCTDATSAADQVTCFSQTAPFLSLLAPGALITAGGLTQGGTSQASPHVAASWAVVTAAAPPGATRILEALQDTGTGITDNRPAGGRTTSRINLLPEPGFGSLAALGTLGLAGLTRRRRKR